MKSFKVAIIDWGNTLSDTTNTYLEIGKVASKVLAKFGIKATAKEYAEAAKLVKKELRIELKGDVKRHEWGTYEKRFAQKLGVKLSNSQAREFDLEMFELFLKHCKLRPGAKRFLDAMKKQGVKLYLVSNSNQQKLEREVKKLGVESYFEKIISSQACGFEKSSLVPFKLVMEDALKKKFASRPSDFIMIGDREEEDGSARKLGIKVKIIDNGDRKAFKKLELEIKK